ncbi:MAG: OmpH family outer membrane protein [Acidobacteria bacterium]|nr:OmpH family outer membrane protein [Acidobacteriota bacterium]
MKIRLFMTLAFLVFAGTGVLAQTGGAAAGQVPKMKVAIIDVLSFRDQLTELKAKYDKLQTEFAPRYQQLESMQSKLAAQEKTLNANTSLSPQQAAKLTEDFEAGKKEYQRMLEDSQVTARKREQEETEAIYDKLSKFLDQYCIKYGITSVFDARQMQETDLIVFAGEKANITDDFIKEYNKANTAPAGVYDVETFNTYQTINAILKNRLFSRS